MNIESINSTNLKLIHFRTLFMEIFILSKKKKSTCQKIGIERLMNKQRENIVSIGISREESRFKRETQTLSLRRKDREERLSKRRNQTLESSEKNSINLNEVGTFYLLLLFSLIYISHKAAIFNSTITFSRFE